MRAPLDRTRVSEKSVPVNQSTRTNMHDEQQTPNTGYDILPSTTAVGYTIGPRKLSANEQFFVGAQTVVNLLKTTEIKQGVSFIATNIVYTSINKTTVVSLNRDGTLFFLPWVDASHVYVRALAQGSFYSLISTRTFLEGAGKRCSECALLLVPEPFWRAAHRVAGQLHGDKEYPFSGVTKSGRVWRKVPESDARSVTEQLSS